MSIRSVSQVVVVISSFDLVPLPASRIRSLKLCILDTLLADCVCVHSFHNFVDNIEKLNWMTFAARDMVSLPCPDLRPRPGLSDSDQTVDVCTARLPIACPKPIAMTLSTHWCAFPFGTPGQVGTHCEQASKLFAAMLDDIVLDVALQSHQEVARSRRKCEVCQTQYVFPPVVGPLCGSGLVDTGRVQLQARCGLVLHHPRVAQRIPN
jgi:hypothetical protein